MKASTSLSREQDKQIENPLASQHPEPPEQILLVPGLFSPRWMLRPLARYLRRFSVRVLQWDDPRILADLDRSVESILQLLNAGECRPGRTAIISHSFGDWITRAALRRRSGPPVGQLISISPVTTAVPMIRWLPRSVIRLVPEFRVMADPSLACSAISTDHCIRHIVFWATIDPLVCRVLPNPHRHVRQHTVWGTHNSLVFQPNVWRRIASELLLR